MSRFTRTRRRRIASTATAVFLLAVASAAAYFLVLQGGAGHGEKTLGTGSAPAPIRLTASWADGLKPGGEAPLTVVAHNEDDQATDVKQLTYNFTTNQAGCLPSWFSIKKVGSANKWTELENGSASVSVPAHSEVTLTSTEANVVFNELALSQSPCESATLTFNMTDTP